MTLDGTRTYLIGIQRIAVIDPGPNDEEHLRAIAHMVGSANAVVVLTHTHPDHAAGAPALASDLGCDVLAAAYANLTDAQVIETDEGPLVALATPGHTPDHVSLHWPSASAVFCGDLMMGGTDTALVAPPEGDLSDYLASLERLRSLRPIVIYPAHGEAFERPDEAIDAYVRHRAQRVAQILDALGDGPRSETALLRDVYGDTLHPGLFDAALGAIRAYLEHLAARGRVRSMAGGEWIRSGAGEKG
jgi:glyoxylase-like metal-dependent hydrolase (beta-lactamase superfamily II)